VISFFKKDFVQQILWIFRFARESFISRDRDKKLCATKICLLLHFGESRELKEKSLLNGNWSYLDCSLVNYPIFLHLTQVGHVDWSMQDHTISRYDVLIGDEI
jgi:hypothetical protein